MRPPGPLLASGRDADIFDYGPGLVLRRARDGRSLSSEARVMAYLHARGYPVPAVDDVSDDGTELVIERIDGPSMVQAVADAPWSVRRHGASLAELHRQLHELPAPDFAPPAPVGAGDRLLHLDLHPLNVIVGPAGPVVIDWARACRGDPAVDVALAWALMAAGQVQAPAPLRPVLSTVRALLVRSFLSGFDRADVATRLGPVVAWKAADPHMSRTETDGLWRLAARAGHEAGGRRR